MPQPIAPRGLNQYEVFVRNKVVERVTASDWWSAFEAACKKHKTRFVWVNQVGLHK